jgi:uncharacterized membrane protein
MIKAESNDPLVSFLYSLMRDHLPAGVVEELVQKCSFKQTTRFTNGYLANYAMNIAKRLKNESVHKT